MFTDEDGGKAAAADGRPPAWILGTAVRSEPSAFPGRDPVRPQGALDCAGDVYKQAGITNPREQIDMRRALRAVLAGTSRCGSRPTTSPHPARAGR